MGEKYRYTYALFGRLLYDPNENPEVWRRTLTHDFGVAAEVVEASLAHASRILPLVTSAHHPSASNNRFWPETYANMPIVDTEADHPCDSPEPRRFGTVSALDPGLFVWIEEFVGEVQAGKPSGRVSPLRVAAILGELAEAAICALTDATRSVADAASPGFRRVAVDVEIQAALGRFIAAKLRAGVAFALYQQSGDRARLPQALDFYRLVFAAWVEAAEHARVYGADITVGGEPWLRDQGAD